MKVIFQKADLDTCLAAAIVGVTSHAEIVYRPQGANEEELQDAAVICLEAGGSGEVALGNFDHHNTQSALPSAATQALQACGRPTIYERLVEYTELVDSGQKFMAPAFPSVSHLVSGIRFLHEHQPIEQFLRGLEELRRIAELGLDPFAPLPYRVEWKPYLEEKRRRTTTLAVLAQITELVHLGSLAIGYAETTAIGAPGALYQLGADVAVVCCHCFGQPPVLKYTISGNGLRVDGLLPDFLCLEPGWGGPAHGTIIASPRGGSRLNFNQVRSVVQAHASELASSVVIGK